MYGNEENDLGDQYNGVKGLIFPYFSKRKKYFYIMEGNLCWISQRRDFPVISQPLNPSYTAQRSLGILFHLGQCLLKKPKIFYSVLRLMYTQLCRKECSKSFNFMVFEKQKYLYSRNVPIRNLHKNLIGSRTFYSSLC